MLSSGGTEKTVVNKHKHVNSTVVQIVNNVKLRFETVDNKPTLA